VTALVFDCDGVLADTERDGHRVAFNHVFAEAGIDFRWSVAEYGDALAVAGGKERLRALLTDEFRARHHLPPGADETEELIAQWHRRKTRVFVELITAGDVPTRDGVARLAAQADDAGWRLAVASTSAGESVRAVLVNAVGPDLAERFVVCAGDDVSRKKPAPDVYLLALDRLGVTNAVAVEDSSVGVRSARAAGLPVVATTSAYSTPEDVHDAAIVVNSLGEPAGPALTVSRNTTSLPIGQSVDLAHLADLIAARS
jgi:HAD superfamily hydrolase (TIGR01509 family)